MADAENNRIQLFKPDGTFIRAIGSKGTDPGQFDFPSGVTFSDTGALVVADSGNDRRQRFRFDPGAP